MMTTDLPHRKPVENRVLDVAWWFVLFVLSPFSWVLATNAAAADAQASVEIIANIESTTYDTISGAMQSQRKFKVRCIVGSNKWTIENDFLIGGEEKWHFDGTNIHHSIRHTSDHQDTNGFAALKKMGFKPTTPSATNLTTYIERSFNGHPLGNAGVNIPWLAFCSADYLSQAGRLVPTPIASLRLAADGFAYTDRTDRFDDGYGLPKAIDLFCSVTLLHKSIHLPHFKGMRDEAGFLRNHPAFRDNEHVFRYAVTAVTNFIGRMLPIEFQWFQNRATSDGRWVRRYEGFGKVETIRTAMEPLQIIQANSQNVIIDYRFSVSGSPNSPLRYKLSGTNLPDVNDPVLHGQLDEKREKLASLPSRHFALASLQRPPGTRVAALVILCSSILILIAVLGRCNKGRQKH